MAETTLPSEQVLAQLKTREFESGFRSPLQHFRGKLDSITGSMVQRGNMPQPKLEVYYNFSGIEVFKSTEPYQSPVAQMNIMLSTRAKSNMGVLGKSIDKIINASLNENAPQAQGKNQDFLVGKVQEWKATPGHMMWDNDKQMETPRDAFEVVYVEGVGGTPYSGAAESATSQPDSAAPAQAVGAGISSKQQALKLLDGITVQEWNNLVFTDPLVKADPDLTVSIVQGTFLPPLEADGTVTKDENGVYHTVG